MSFTFSPEQLAEIQRLYDAALLRTNNGLTSNFADVYAYIRDQITPSILHLGVDTNVASWFSFGTDANAGIGAASVLIRSYTQRQGELRGLHFTDEKVQQASNAVAMKAFKEILDNNGLLTSLDKIANNDATAIGSTLYEFTVLNQDSAFKNNAAWSGNVLFSGLGEDQSWRLLGVKEDGAVNTVSDLKDVLFTYDALFHALEDVVANGRLSDVLEQFLNYGPFSTAVTIKETINAFFSNTMAQPYATMVANLTPENYLDALRKIVDPNAAQATNASNFVDRANELFYGQNKLDSGLSVKLLDQISPARLAELATNEIAFRYALKELNPFAVFGVNYAAHNANGELDLYDQVTGQGEMTEQYLTDRARFAVLNAQALQTFEPNLFQSFDYFEDINTQTSIGIPVLTDKFIFGGDGNDPIEGGIGDDHLYGGAGYDVINGNDGNDYLEGNGQNDILSGGSGNDKLFGGKGDDTLGGGTGNDNLEGGLGNDTYIYNSGDGFDAIADLGIVIAPVPDRKSSRVHSMHLLGYLSS
jgi:RTX calcium-binding nonapeptide repeat (4 copies)